MAADKDDDWKSVLLLGVARFFLVFGAIFILVLLGAFPFRLAGLFGISPAFLLMAVYYWAVTRPETLPPPAVFLSGIFLDLLSGLPLGMTALLLLCTQWVTRRQRKFLLGQNFPVIWAAFALVTLCVEMLSFLIFCGFHGNLVPVAPLLVSAILTTVLFPVFVPAFAFINKALEEWLDAR